MPRVRRSRFRIPLRLVVALLAPLLLAVTLPAQPLTGPQQENILHFSRTTFAETGDDVDLAFMDTEFTLELWLYLTETDPALQSSLLLRPSGQDVATLAVQDGDLWLSFDDGTTSAALIGPAIPSRHWVHVAATLDDGDLRLYTDGDLEAEWTDAVQFVRGFEGPLRVGHFTLTAAMAQVRIWSRALSGAELEANRTTPPPADAPGLEAYWPFDEGAGQVLVDRTANGIPLVLGGREVRTVWDPYWNTRDELESGPYFERSFQPVPPAPSWDLRDMVFDYDRDGDSDVFDLGGVEPSLMQPTPPFYDADDPPNPVRIWRNDGGVFVDATESVLGPEPVQMVNPSRSRIGDLTGDGLPDLYVAEGGPDVNLPNPDSTWGPAPGGPDRLFVGQPDGSLKEESATRLPFQYGFTHDVSLGDVDRDGDLDVLLADLGSTNLEYQCCRTEPGSDICHGEPQTYEGLEGRACSRFLINDGSGHFTAAYDRIPLDIANLRRTTVYAVQIFDADGGNGPDLFLSPLTRTEELDRDILLYNDGDGTFTDAPPDALPAWGEVDEGPTVLCAADYDGRNGQDLFLAIPGHNTMRLFLSHGDGTFFDASDRLSVPHSHTEGDVTAEVFPWTLECSVDDLNRDGRPDIVTTGSQEKSWILMNRGNAEFEVATPTIAEFRGGWAARLDHDDRPDLVAWSQRNGQTGIDVYRNLKDYEPEPLTDEGDCPPGHPTLLCLGDQRFEVSVAWRDFQGATGHGQVVPFGNAGSGLFYFFGPDNWEILVKVLDGCDLNDRFWVFSAATTTVEYTLTVKDTVTGEATSYFNPLGVAAPSITDTDALRRACGVGLRTPAGDATELAMQSKMQTPASSGLEVRSRRATPSEMTQKTCTPSDTAYCLNGGRFRVEVEWKDFDGVEGVGKAVPGVPSHDSGLFYFFGEENWEILVKVLDGCDLNDHFWIFAAATTTLEFTLRITDTQTGEERTYFNPLGNAAESVTDTGALSCS